MPLLFFSLLKNPSLQNPPQSMACSSTQWNGHANIFHNTFVHVVDRVVEALWPLGQPAMGRSTTAIIMAHRKLSLDRQTDRETERRNKEETDNVTARVLKEVRWRFARHKMGWSREREGREWFHWTRVQVPRMSHANLYSTVHRVAIINLLSPSAVILSMIICKFVCCRPYNKECCIFTGDLQFIMPN